MDVELPEITTEVQSSPYPLIVYMNQNLANQNKVYFFNQEIPVENLSDALTKKIYELPSSFRVYLNIDQSVSFKHMYKILQELKEAGIKNVIISTKPKESL